MHTLDHEEHPPVFISGATAGSPYVQEMAQCVAAAAAVGVAVEPYTLPPARTWKAGTTSKILAITRARDDHPGRAVVWLDADARMVRSPALLLSLPWQPVDFAAHWLRGKELISATLYFAATLMAEMLLADWRGRCQAAPESWDQTPLQRCVEAFATRHPLALLRELPLPPEYNWIDACSGMPDISATVYGVREPVIIQTQASRRYRKPYLT